MPSAPLRIFLALGASPVASALRAGAAFLLLAGVGPASARPAESLTRKLDSGLASWAAEGTESRTIWVAFTDKVPLGPADAAARLV
ncbi:MAG: hypothetical protein ABIS67_12785, partial [Candidatus Eisenbacteria bacterium]